MNRAELQVMTRERVLDAETLIQGQRWSFAYYVAGYAVECALKSCLLARMIHTGWVFKEKVKIEECRTHDFKELIKLAGLTELLNQRFKDDATQHGAFVKNWGMVDGWKVEERYVPKTESEARSLLDAITDPQDGVLLWIMKYW